MVKPLTFKHFFIVLVSFWLATLIGASHSFEYQQRINFILGAFFLICFLPVKKDKQKISVLCLLAAIEILLSLILPAKFWCAWLFVGLVGGAFFIYKEQMTATIASLLMIWVASFFNLAFITNTHVSDVQYDFLSCYNYIEYIMENHFLFWQENPLLTRPSYSAYHPILHFFMAGLAIDFAKLLFFSKDAADEAVQILFVSYMFWYGLLCARILAIFHLKTKVYLPCLAFIVFFPTYHAIAGFFNNDCLLLPLQAGVIYYSLLYYQNGGRKNLWFILLFATAAALTKLSGILVLPATAVALLFRLLKEKNKQTLYEEIVFSILLLFGISLWTLYQYFVLHIEFSYVPPQNHLSLKSYSFWERFNPIGAFFYQQMFYNDFGINLWETMTKTALFGQWDFSYRGLQIIGLIEFFVLIYKTLIALLSVAVCYLLFKAKYKKLFILSLVLLLSLLGGQIAFGLKHPFMCNQDFRYVAILPLVFSMIFAQFLQQMNTKFAYFCSLLLVLFSFLSVFIWHWVSI